jgi:hypothetical protein
MTLLFRRRPSPATCIAVAALVVATAGVTYAAIPDAKGQINGCYSDTRGLLRVVDDGVACESTEKALAWSQTGPAGPPGAAGATGATGPQGATGAAGPAGLVRAYTYIGSDKAKEVPDGFMPPGRIPKTAVASLGVPFGLYHVVAKANIFSFGHEPDDHRSRCDLIGGASVDRAVISHSSPPGNSGVDEMIMLTIVTRFAPVAGRGSPRIYLRCTDFGAAPPDARPNPAKISDIRITAIPIVGETTTPG